MKNSRDPVLVAAVLVFILAITLQVFAYQVCVVGGFNHLASLIEGGSEPKTKLGGLLVSMVREQIAGYLALYIILFSSATFISVGSFAVVVFRKTRQKSPKDGTPA